jgi:hypothetical protein
MDEPIGFDEFRWLQELAHKTPKGAMPEPIEARLLKRRFIERKAGHFLLTARGRLALAKLG